MQAPLVSGVTLTPWNLSALTMGRSINNWNVPPCLLALTAETLLLSLNHESARSSVNSHSMCESMKKEGIVDSKATLTSMSEKKAREVKHIPSPSQEDTYSTYVHMPTRQGKEDLFHYELACV